ncbi:MAG: hypothetical protein IJX79_03890 [Clostridia bacterium]|nr:hypothetical protein [Clostridia bacterium]
MLNKTIEDYKKEMLKMYSKSVMVSAPLPQYPTDDSSSGQGSLIVILTTARGAFPLSGGEVRVYENESGALISTLRTDENGHTAVLSLPAPRRILSESPSQSGAATFSLYDIEAARSGFKTTRIKSVPIFDGVTSLQTVDMLSNSAENGSSGTNYDTQNTYEL